MGSVTGPVFTKDDAYLDENIDLIEKHLNALQKNDPKNPPKTLCFNGSDKRISTWYINSFSWDKEISSKAAFDVLSYTLDRAMAIKHLTVPETEPTEGSKNELKAKKAENERIKRIQAKADIVRDWMYQQKLNYDKESKYAISSVFQRVLQSCKYTAIANNAPLPIFKEGFTDFLKKKKYTQPIAFQVPAAASKPENSEKKPFDPKHVGAQKCVEVNSETLLKRLNSLNSDPKNVKKDLAKEQPTQLNKIQAENPMSAPPPAAKKASTPKPKQVPVENLSEAAKKAREVINKRASVQIDPKKAAAALTAEMSARSRTSFTEDSARNMEYIISNDRAEKRKSAPSELGAFISKVTQHSIAQSDEADETDITQSIIWDFNPHASQASVSAAAPPPRPTANGAPVQQSVANSGVKKEASKPSMAALSQLEEWRTEHDKIRAQANATIDARRISMKGRSKDNDPI